jgi:hypothetical protein
VGRKAQRSRFAADPPLPRREVEWVLEDGLHSQWRDRAGIDRLPCYARLGTEGTYSVFKNYRSLQPSRARAVKCRLGASARDRRNGRHPARRPSPIDWISSESSSSRVASRSPWRLTVGRHPVVEVFVGNRRLDPVAAVEPFAEVDGPTALGTEGAKLGRLSRFSEPPATGRALRFHPQNIGRRVQKRQKNYASGRFPVRIGTWASNRSCAPSPIRDAGRSRARS